MTHSLPYGVKKITGLQPGPKVAIVGVTHGDEPAGLAALEFLEDYFTEHDYPAGELYLVRGNLEAADRNQRFVDYDMNRLFWEDRPDWVDPSWVDYQRAEQLKPLLAEMDFVLDIHSTSKPSVPFALGIGRADHSRFMKTLPVEFFSHGWVGKVLGSMLEWFEDQGDGIGVAVECGWHGDPVTRTIAIQSVKAFLNAAGATNFELEMPPCEKGMDVLVYERVGDAESFEYAHDYVTLDAIQPGELIAWEKGKEFRAPEAQDLVILFPANLESIRKGVNVDAYFLGQFYSLT